MVSFLPNKKKKKKKLIKYKIKKKKKKKKYLIKYKIKKKKLTPIKCMDSVVTTKTFSLKPREILSDHSISV